MSVFDQKVAERNDDMSVNQDKRRDGENLFLLHGRKTAPGEKGLLTFDRRN